MKLSTRQDIEATEQDVFAEISDFARFERQARHRGIEVTRLDDGSEGPNGAQWRLRFSYRGRSRKLEARVATWDPPQMLTIKGGSDGLDMTMEAELLALSRGRTRLFFSIDLRPRTFPARLLIQSLKLAKDMIGRRVDARVASFAAEVEKRHAPRG